MLKNLYNLYIKNIKRLDDLYIINNEFHRIIDESIISTYLNKQTELFIKENELKYSNNTELIFKNINYYLDIFKKNNINVKQRTIAPIIKIYCYLNDISNIEKLWFKIENEKIDILESDYLNLVKFCIIKNKKKLLVLILNFMMKNILNVSDLFIKGLNIFLKKIEVNENGVTDSEIKLERIEIDNKIHKNFCKFLEKLIENNNIKISKYFKNFLIKNNEINVVIDGANVGFYQKNNKINFKYIDQVNNKLIELGFKPLIFLHKRHFKNLNVIETNIFKSWEKKNQLFRTPYKIDDDIYWLYGTLYLSLLNNNSCLFVTKDKIKDHYYEIFKSNLDNEYKISNFKRWYVDNNIDYNIFKNVVEIIKPSNFSKCIQKFNIKNKIYYCFPNDKSWYYLTI